MDDGNHTLESTRIPFGGTWNEGDKFIFLVTRCRAGIANHKQTL